MASFEDYDEFGNYIGAGLDSEDDSETNLQSDFMEQQHSSLLPEEGQPLEGFSENVDDSNLRLMEVDGEDCSLFHILS